MQHCTRLAVLTTGCLTSISCLETEVCSAVRQSRPRRAHCAWLGSCRFTTRNVMWRSGNRASGSTKKMIKAMPKASRMNSERMPSA